MSEPDWVGGITELGRGLFWKPDEVVLVVWAYFDESGEYENGKLLNMTVGGCVSTLEKWKTFDLEWRKVLERENLPFFHMSDFEAWVPPFDFKLENGERDKARHNRILNDLLEIMFSNVEGLYGYGAVTMSEDSAKAHSLAIEDCISSSLRHAYTAIHESYDQSISLVYDRSNHISDSRIHDLAWSHATKRVKSITTGNSRELTPLQAADIFAYEMARAQRDTDRQRYPFTRMVKACRENRLRMGITWRVSNETSSRGPLVGAQKTFVEHGKRLQQENN